MGHQRLAAAGAGVKIGIEDAGGAGELELSRRAFPDVQVRLAELADQSSRVAPDHPFLAGDGGAAHGHLGRGGRLGRRRGGAGGGQEQERQTREAPL